MLKVTEIYRNVYGKRQTSVSSCEILEKKNETCIKGKAFRDFFFFIYTVEICPFNSKGRWTPISLSWFSWFDKIFVFLEKKLNYIEGLSKITRKAARLNHAAQ